MTPNLTRLPSVAPAQPQGFPAACYEFPPERSKELYDSD